MPMPLLATVTAAAALAAPAFGPARPVEPLTGPATPLVAADARGDQFVAYRVRNRGITLLRRSFPGGWASDPAAAAAPPAAFPTAVGVAGKGAALLAWDAYTPPRGAQHGVLVQDAGQPTFGDIGTSLPSAWEKDSSVSALSVDAAGRVLAVAVADRRAGSASTLQLVARPPGGGFGRPIRLDEHVSFPTLATSPAGRTILAWGARSGTKMVSVERGVPGRVVTLDHGRYGTVVAAVGLHGEAAVISSTMSRDRHGYHFTKNIVLRGRHGGFGRPVPLRRSVYGSPVVGDDGWVLVGDLRSAPRARTARHRRPRRFDVLLRLIDPARPQRLVTVRLDRGLEASMPTIAAVRGGALVTWSRGVGGDPAQRQIRAVYVRTGRVSRATDVADYTGRSYPALYVLRGTQGGATILWLVGTKTVPYELDAADTAVALGP